MKNLQQRPCIFHKASVFTIRPFFFKEKNITDPCLMQSFELIASLNDWIGMALEGAQPFCFTDEDQRGWPEVIQMNQSQSWDKNQGLMMPKPMLFPLFYLSHSPRHLPFWEYSLHGPYCHCIVVTVSWWCWIPLLFFFKLMLFFRSFDKINFRLVVNSFHLNTSSGNSPKWLYSISGQLWQRGYSFWLWSQTWCPGTSVILSGCVLCGPHQASCLSHFTFQKKIGCIWGFSSPGPTSSAS